MSLKAIEMQVALPRTHEAGKTAQQHQYQGQLMQEYAAQEMEKVIEHKRQAVTELEQKDEAVLKRDHSSNNLGGEAEQKKKKKEASKEAAVHPYKGQSIDFSG